MEPFDIARKFVSDEIPLVNGANLLFVAGFLPIVMLAICFGVGVFFIELINPSILTSGAANTAANLFSNVWMFVINYNLLVAYAVIVLLVLSIFRYRTMLFGDNDKVTLISWIIIGTKTFNVSDVQKVMASEFGLLNTYGWRGVEGQDINKIKIYTAIGKYTVYMDADFFDSFKNRLPNSVPVTLPKNPSRLYAIIGIILGVLVIGLVLYALNAPLL